MSESKNQHGIENFLKVSNFFFRSFKEGFKIIKSLDWADYVFVITPYSLTFLYFWAKYMAINWKLAYVTLGFYVATAIICMGLKKVLLIRKYQFSLDHVKVGSSTDLRPVVLNVSEDGIFKTITVMSKAIGLQNYENKKGDLEAAFAQLIDSINSNSNPEIVVIKLCKQKLANKVSFLENDHLLMNPYSFVVGQGRSGMITTSIEKLPHMLIAGTTGGGKSIFFKQMLLGLLKSSNNLQLYLIDLKEGLEMSDFILLPNVKVAKNESEANSFLKGVKQEMERRFKFLHENNKKEINPLHDRLDRIVVGIDEASVIYTTSKYNKSKNNTVNESRELTDEIAKLGRAAGIHLILCTQKVSKETIDTKVQENIGGRVCFRTNSLMGSVAMLGNKLAYEIPAVPGRAIWGHGHDFIEIQAPFLTEKELKFEINEIKNGFELQKKKFFGPLINVEGKIIPSKNQQRGGL